MGPFLVLLGVLLFWIASQGKSDPFLQAMGIDFSKQEQNIADDLKAWANNNLFRPFSNAIRMALPPWLRGPGLGQEDPDNTPNPQNPPNNPDVGIFPCPDNPNAPCIDNPADPSHPLHIVI